MPEVMITIVIVILLMIPGVSIGASVYLNDGGIVECQSFWKDNNGVHVKVNDNLVLYFNPNEVDNKKTFKSGHKNKIKTITKNTTTTSTHYNKENVARSAQSVNSEKYRTLSNKEFGFDFQYPASWLIGEPSTPTSRATVASPENTPLVICTVIVERDPQLNNISQSSMDRYYSNPSSLSEIRSALNKNSEILSASLGVLHSHPAFILRSRSGPGATYGQTFVSASMVLTATPGLHWTLSCIGQGKTPVEAETNFQYWQVAINRLILSFRFK